MFQIIKDICYKICMWEGGVVVFQVFGLGVVNKRLGTTGLDNKKTKTNKIKEREIYMC